MASHQNHQRKDYRLLRAVTLWLYDHVCFVCKEKFDTLECHHINKNSKDNRIENFIPLCKECHVLLGKIKIQPQITPNEIIKLLEQKIAYYKSRL